MRGLPWWFRRSSVEGDEHTLGTPGEGKVLVVTQRDALGDPVERTWVDESIAWQYDDTRWSPHL